MGIELENIIIRVWPVGILLLGVLTLAFWRKTRSFFHRLAFFLWGIYLLVLIDRVYFPIQVSGAYADAMRENLSFASQVNLRLIFFDWHYGVGRALWGFLLNILLTIPFGFGIHFVQRIPKKYLYWIGVWLGLGIELIQLLISLFLGFPYRVIDINDLLANLLGVWVGIWLFLGFAWAYRKMASQAVNRPIKIYLDEVTRQSGHKSTN